MYVVRGKLPAEVGALLMRAIEAASAALYQERRPPEPEAERERAAAQRRADAIGLIAERALAAGRAASGGCAQAQNHRRAGPAFPNGGAPLPARPVAALMAQNHARGVQPDAWTCGGRRSAYVPGRWKREADIPDEVLLPALAAAG